MALKKIEERLKPFLDESSEDLRASPIFGVANKLSKNRVEAVFQEFREWAEDQEKDFEAAEAKIGFQSREVERVKELVWVAFIALVVAVSGMAISAHNERTAAYMEILKEVYGREKDADFVEAPYRVVSPKEEGEKTTTPISGAAYLRWRLSNTP